MTVSLSAADGGGGGAVNNGGTVNSGGRRVLAAKTDSLNNVNNNNNNEPIVSPSNTGKASVLTVRRVLFGPPADPAETRAWLDRQLCAATAADSQSWNFDFINERPLRDNPADRYAWERVCPPQQQQQRYDESAGNEAMDTDMGPLDYRRSAGKKRQSKVTDFMSKTKKRSMAGAGSLRSKKIVEEGMVGNKRSRRSMATMAI